MSLPFRQSGTFGGLSLCLISALVADGRRLHRTYCQTAPVSNFRSLQPVYNLGVGDWQTYLVSGATLLSHNASTNPTPPVPWNEWFPHPDGQWFPLSISATDLPNGARGDIRGGVH